MGDCNIVLLMHYFEASRFSRIRRFTAFRGSLKDTLIISYQRQFSVSKWI